MGEGKNVCPYYMNLDLSRWCDNIVCDYNYVFDPNASLSQFFSEGIGQDFIFLIDEAHNLIERGRDMYSASFTKEEVLLIKKKINTGAFGIVSALNKLNREFLEIRKSFDEITLEETGANAYFPDNQEIADFMNAIGRVVNAFQMILEKRFRLKMKTRFWSIILTSAFSTRFTRFQTHTTNFIFHTMMKSISMRTCFA